MRKEGEKTWGKEEIMRGNERGKERMKIKYEGRREKGGRKRRAKLEKKKKRRWRRRRRETSEKDMK